MCTKHPHGVPKFRQVGYRFVSTILFFVLSVAPAMLSAQAGPEGSWSGRVTIPNLPAGLDVRLTFTASADGAVVGTIDIPAQGATGIPLAGVAYDHPEIRFEIPSAPPAKFVVSLDGDRMTGSFEQGQLLTDFSADRLPEGAAPAVPSGPPAEPAGSSVLRVGDARINGSGISAYEGSFALVGVSAEGETNDAGRWTDKVSFVDEGGTPKLRREVARYTAEGVMDLWRVHIVDPVTMESSLTDQRFGPDLRSVIRVEQDGAAIRQVIVSDPNQKALVNDVALPETPFDLSLYAVLLMAFPREPGFSAEFPITAAGGGVAYEMMTVDGVETVEFPDGTSVSATKISTKFRNWSVWLMDEAPYIAKIVQRSSDGGEVISVPVR